MSDVGDYEWSMKGDYDMGDTIKVTDATIEPTVSSTVKPAAEPTAKNDAAAPVPGDYGGSGDFGSDVQPRKKYIFIIH